MTDLFEPTFWKEYCTEDGTIHEINSIHERVLLDYLYQ